MFDPTKILLGIIEQKYYYLINPLSFLIMGLAIKYKLKEKEGYVGRLSMFSNSMALFSFYAFIPNTPFFLFLFTDFAIILGVIGIVAYITNKELSTKNYYKYTRWFDSIIVGILISIYYFVPSLFK